MICSFSKRSLQKFILGLYFKKSVYIFESIIKNFKEYNPITTSSCRDKSGFESFCAENANSCGKNLYNPSAGMDWDDACKKSCNKCQGIKKSDFLMK